MTTFKRSMEAHKIEYVKWPVLLTLQLTGKLQQVMQLLTVKTARIILRSRRPYLKGCAMFRCEATNFIA